MPYHIRWTALKRYEDVLQYAGSKSNFIFGLGLYMAPIDILLRIDQIAGYNNETVVATTISGALPKKK